MQLTAKVKLKTTPEQTDTLKRTMHLANTCCNWLSGRAWENHRFGQFSLHKVAYHEARKTFPCLSSQMICRCEAKVSQAYRLDIKTKRIFKPLGAIEYDGRILTWYVDRREVSIWSVDGRLRLKFYCGQRQLDLLQGKIGQADLVLIGNDFYLFAPCAIEEAEPIDVIGVLGIDLGIVNIATDSDGQIYSGAQVNSLRYRHRRLRQKLQKKGTQAAKRLLRKRGKKEHRFAQHENHCIAKIIVRKAKDTRRAIALEDLKGIRQRTTVRRSQRAAHDSWAFYDLRQKIEYKAQLAGIPMILVDPRNTSRTCPICGAIDKRNRPTQSLFSCVSCGFSGLADTIAACIIAGRAVCKPAALPGCAVNRAVLGESSPL
jgi:IS605 OrfB family transposase